MDTATKTGINAAKTASKKVVQKTAEAIGDLIRNKIAGKINQKIKRIMNQTEYKKVIYHQKNSTNHWWIKIFLDPVWKWNTKKLQAC